MMAQMPSGLQWNLAGRAPLTSFTMQQTMQNKVSKLDLNSETVVQKLKAPTTSREDARRPNRDAFRKFDVDEFEIPMGDDFFGMTEVSVGLQALRDPIMLITFPTGPNQTRRNFPGLAHISGQEQQLEIERSHRRLYSCVLGGRSPTGSYHVPSTWWRRSREGFENASLVICK